jgi:hypothetical protein
MGAVDLAAEHLAGLRNMRQRHLDHLLGRGVSGRAYVAAGCIGIERVRFSSTTYEPTEDDEQVFIQPVHDGLDRLCDLLAWRPRQPDRWALRCDAAFALGEAAIADADWANEPLELHSTPLAWLQGDCRGAVVLRPAEAWFELHMLTAVVAADVAHGERVRRMLTPPLWPAPRVLVRRMVAA